MFLFITSISHFSLASIFTGKRFSEAKTKAGASSCGAFSVSMVSCFPSALTIWVRTLPQHNMNRERYASPCMAIKSAGLHCLRACSGARMRDNNSSAFNFRYISYSTKMSKHALGLAVDINTLYNPYVKYVDGRRNVEPANAEKYTDRSIEFPHKIDHDDLCYKVFAEHGFEWGGDWEHAKDYQHFEMPDEWIEKSSCRKM